MKLRPIDLPDLLVELDSMIAANPLAEVAPTAVDEGGSFVLFLVSSRTYAISVDSVAAVLLAPNLCSVPHAPDWLEGVFYWGGGVVPLLSATVLDGLRAPEEGEPEDRQKLGDEQGTRSGRCLVLACGEVKVAVRVDEVFGVHRLAPRPEEPPVGKSHQQESGAAGAGGGKLSEALRWQLVPSVPEEEAHKRSALPGTPDKPRRASEVRGSVAAPAGRIRVLSVVGLLASERISRYANLSALDLALADGSTEEPYGSGRS